MASSVLEFMVCPLVLEMSPLVFLGRTLVGRRMHLRLGRVLRTIDVLHSGTGTHEIRTSESRDNAMSRRNLRRVSRVI